MKRIEKKLYLNQIVKDCKKTANLTNYANWLAQVNLGANYSNLLAQVFVLPLRGFFFQRELSLINR